MSEEQSTRLIQGELTTKAAYKEALDVAMDFLRVYSPNKPPRFVVPPSSDLLQPEKRIREALAEAQFILNQTSGTALQKRADLLRSSRNKQRWVNMLHFITGSGFVSLIALDNPGPVKWLGAAVSLIAGILALTLPKNPSTIEMEILRDIRMLSSLAGEISQIQTELLFTSVEKSERLQGRIALVIGHCMELSKKYELDRLAEFTGGIYPREKYPVEDTNKEYIEK